MYKIPRNLKDNCIVQRIKIIYWLGAAFALNYSFLSKEVWLLNKETIFKDVLYLVILFTCCPLQSNFRQNLTHLSILAVQGSEHPLKSFLRVLYVSAFPVRLSNSLLKFQKKFDVQSLLILIIHHDCSKCNMFIQGC
jgi:hypothetical protein